MTTPPHTQVIAAGDARTLFKNNTAAAWPNVVAEFGGEVWPQLHPSFRLKPTDVIFTIGSCFARNVEDHLARLGCTIPMLDFRLPAAEWHGDPNGALNKFSPPAFRQSLEWTAAIHDRDGKVTWEDCAPLAWNSGDDRYVDLELLAHTPVSRDRFIERRQHIFDITRTAFTADCVMMTPGLIEAWRHTESGQYIHGFKGRHMVSAMDAFQIEVLGYPQCMAEMLASIDIVRARNPDVKVLVTTSPVPLTATFTQADVRVANTYSKSVLRAVCGALVLERPMVDYFPSYECVTLSKPEAVWQEDRIHVRPGFVGGIVRHLLNAYFDGVDEASLLHQQASTELADHQYAEAAEHAAAALALKPADEEIRLVLIDALVAEHRVAEARAAIAPLEGEIPERAAVIARLARILHLQGEADAAVETGLRACAAPDATVGHFNWTIKRLMVATRHVEAESLARQLVDRKPQQVAAYQPLINLLTRQERKEEVIDILRKVTQLPLPKPEHLALLDKLTGARSAAE